MTGTQAIDRAAQLLVLVVENESSSSVGELAEAAGLPKSTVSRAVSALERQGLVQRSSARGSIRPGPVLLGLARRGVSEEDIAELCREALDNLADATGETIDLAVAVPGGSEQYIAQVDSRHILGTTNWVGRRLPHHCTAVGKVLVAFGAARLQRGVWSGSPPTPSPIAPRCRQNWIRCGHADMRPPWASWSRAWWPLRRRCLMPTAGPWQRSASRGRSSGYRAIGWTGLANS